MTAQEWVEEFARRIDGEAPTKEEFEQVLALAAAAAHSSHRTAAPVACWVAGRAGLPLAEAIKVGEAIEGEGGEGGGS